MSPAQHHDPFVAQHAALAYYSTTAHADFSSGRQLAASFILTRRLDPSAAAPPQHLNGA